jgi:hypothetical protein
MYLEKDAGTFIFHHFPFRPASKWNMIVTNLASAAGLSSLKKTADQDAHIRRKIIIFSNLDFGR